MSIVVPQSPGGTARAATVHEGGITFEVQGSESVRDQLSSGKTYMTSDGEEGDVYKGEKDGAKRPGKTKKKLKKVTERESAEEESGAVNRGVALHRQESVELGAQHKRNYTLLQA